MNEPWEKPKRAPRRKHKLYASGINDLRCGIDHVVRDADGRAFVGDPDGIYAPVEVDGDVITDAVRERLQSLTGETAAKMFNAVQQSAVLSPEGRRERLRALLEGGGVRLTFTVE